MLNLIKSELKRALTSKNMVFAIIISIASMFIGLNSMLWHNYRGVTYSYELAVYTGPICLLAIIISAIPFSTSYISEYESNYYTYIKHKVGSYKYIFTKFIVNFIAGGLVLFIPFITFYLLLLVLKGVSNEDLSYGLELNKTLVHIYNQSQVKYMLIKILLTTICGSTFATLALGISIYIRNKYLTILFPFLCYVGSAMFLSDYNLNAQMIFNLDIDTNIPISYRLTYALAIIAISIILFIIKYALEDNKN